LPSVSLLLIVFILLKFIFNPFCEAIDIFDRATAKPPIPTLIAELINLSRFAFIKFIPPLLNWLFFDATFKGSSKAECYGDGACWIFITIWFKKFIYGLYPNDQIWRINLAFLILVFSVITSIFVKPIIRRYIIIFLIFIFPFLAIWLIGGVAIDIESLEIYIPILEEIDTRVWGGLSLTFIIAIFAMLFCFPIGIILALGRRSGLPTIRYSSIAFIEFWRGVPLITVLFMASVMFPLFLPADAYVDKLMRCVIGITLFEAAYMAEVVRGGLQALPKGQYDAAKSLGMGYWQMNALIILPQALKIVIPGIANTFIALFKDTPLILVVGLLEFLGMIKLAGANPDWLGFAVEGYVFAATVYWIFCFSMSRYSQKLEIRFSTERK